MTVSTTVEVVGAKKAIVALRKIDPDLRKQFNGDVKRIAAPAIEAGQSSYDRVPLSNMRYAWGDRGRNVFPFTVEKARRGVQVKIDTRGRATASILIQQMDAAAAIFETAGRKSFNRLGQSLDFVANERGFRRAQPGRTRLIGPAVYKARRLIEKEMAGVILRVINDVERELR